jgi:general stress protein 13
MRCLVVEKYMKGRILKGVVTGIEPYGVFVQFDDYYSGLIHISEISDGFVKNPADYVKVGEIINAKIIDVDDQMGHLKLSIKNIKYKEKTPMVRRKIIETSLGFKTLSYNLPIWIKESLSTIEQKSVDKKY